MISGLDIACTIVADHERFCVLIRPRGGMVTAQRETASSVRVDAPHERTHHRLRCVYAVSGIEANRHGAPVCTSLKMGRFLDHYRDAGRSLPGIVGTATLPPDGFRWAKETPDVTITAATAFLFSVPNSRPVVALELDFTGDALEAIPLLRETCFERNRVGVAAESDETPLLAAILAGAPEGSLTVGPEARFDRDVHQLFMPAAAQHDLQTIAEDGVTTAPDVGRLARFVYRANDDYRVEYAAIKVPKELNRPTTAVAGHARGVTVLAGSAEHIENAAFVVAVQLLSAAATLRTITRRASEALHGLDASVRNAGHLDERRAVLSALGTELSRLQVELSFGVEANTMPIHVPEVVLEHYQASLTDSLGLDTGCDVTSKMLERLSIAMSATAGSLLAIEQERDNGRRQRWVIAIGWLSTAAIPLSIVFGFFGMNAKQVHGSASMLPFDSGRYTGFYLVLLALVVISVLLFTSLSWLGNRERKHLETLSALPLRDVLSRMNEGAPQ
jgi:hypothetical protein